MASNTSYYDAGSDYETDERTNSVLKANSLLISRSVYNGAKLHFGDTLPNGSTAVANGSYPNVWNNETPDPSFGITSPIYIDQITTSGKLINSVNVTDKLKKQGIDISTSFPSKSELGLSLSSDGSAVTFMAYEAAPQSLDISNSNTPSVVDPTNLVGDLTTKRAVVQFDKNFNLQVTPVNAYSGNNGRNVVLGNDGYYYMVGNAGNSGKGVTGANLSTLSNDTGVQMIAPFIGGNPNVGPQGNTTVVGAVKGNFGSTTGYERGFSITDLPGVTTPDKTGKDDNFRGLTINPFDNSIYVSKGSGGNGVNTVYKVTPTSGTLPTLANAGTANISILPGFSTTLASSSTGVIYHPFGLWFANATTLYVADEGTPLTTTGTKAAPLSDAAKDVNAGLEKWSFNGTKWVQDYTLQKGLNLGVSYSVAKGSNGEVYPLSFAPATAGLRNITGKVNADGTVSIYAATSTVSTETDQGADPNKIVAITDRLSFTTASQAAKEKFTTIEGAKYGNVYRGVSLAPTALGDSQDHNVAKSEDRKSGGIGDYKHVLIISVDGLHNSDLSVANLQSSLTNIKRLQKEGVTFSNAFASAPSDSFPGELNYITGANPGTTGVFYDKSYSRSLYAPGTKLADVISGVAKPGTDVEFAENVDKTWANNGALSGSTNGTLDGGKGFDTSTLPLRYIPATSSQLAQLVPVYPNEYLNVNTIFDVANKAGLTTAWSDKHPAAYTILAGNDQLAVNSSISDQLNPANYNFKTGQVGSITDYSSLEINAAVAIDTSKQGPLKTSAGALVDQSVIPYDASYFKNGKFNLPFVNGAYRDSTGNIYYSNAYTKADGSIVTINPNITSNYFNDATKGNKGLFAAPPIGTTSNQFDSTVTTSTYDDYKVRQVLNEIDGLNSSGTHSASTPSIYGLNIQAVSVAEKDPGTLFNGGGIDANGNARPDLVNAINHTDQSIGLILDELQKTGQADSTLVVLTAKHGQNPVQDPTVGLNSTFDSQTGKSGGDGNLTAFGALLVRNGIQIDSERGGDTSSLLYLKNQADTQKAVDLLNAKSYSFDNAIDPITKVAFSTEDAASQGSVLSGQGIINTGLGNPKTNDRTPDIVVELNNGYFFGNAAKKRSEHGGFTDADTHVALIVGSKSLSAHLKGTTDALNVSTTQIAPTTLEALGLDPNLLLGVQIDGTQDLGIFNTKDRKSDDHKKDLGIFNTKDGKNDDHKNSDNGFFPHAKNGVLCGDCKRDSFFDSINNDVFPQSLNSFSGNIPKFISQFDFEDVRDAFSSSKNSLTSNVIGTNSNKSLLPSVGSDGLSLSESFTPWWLSDSTPWWTVR